MNLRFGGWNPALDHRTEPAKRDAQLKRLQAQAKIAGELKIDSCATYIMSSSDLPFLENWRQHVQGLRPTAQVLADHGLRFGLEFLGPYHIRYSRRHEFIFTPGQMLELADDVGPNVGLLVDSYHAYTSATPWKRLGQLPAEKVVWVHFNDAAKLPLPELKDNERLLPGDGVMDGAGFLKAIHATGYKGPVSVEVFGALTGVEPKEAAKRAGEATMKVWRQAGLDGSR